MMLKTSNFSGKIKAIIVDWAGTVIDFGSIAPVVAFVELFRKFDVPISMEEARVPMGADKKTHIKELLNLSSINHRWVEFYKRQPDLLDVEKMYEQFILLQIECIGDYSKLIPGTLETVEILRQRSYKIGSTTGYTGEIIKLLAAEAKKQGFHPDAIVCSSDVSKSRPYPNMVYKNIVDLGVLTARSCVKIDDTGVGIEEGLNAGCWTIGLAVCGNNVGLSIEEWDQLDDSEKEKLRSSSHDKLRKAGAHYVVDSFCDIIPCLDDIERRLAAREQI